MVQNDAGTTADSWHKTDTAGSREVHAVFHFGQERHRRAAAMLLCALTAHSDSAWDGLAAVLAARLSMRERCELAFAALAGLPSEARARTVAALGPADPDLLHSDLWRQVCREFRLNRARAEQAARHAH